MDWRRSVDVRAVLAAPEVRARMRAASRTFVPRADAVTFLRAVGPVAAAAGGPSGPDLVRTSAAVHRHTSSWGIRRTRTHTERVAHPPGSVIATVLVAMARLGVPLDRVQQHDDGCVLTGPLPSSWLIFSGTLTIRCTVESAGVLVDARTVVPGQLVDWGTGRRALRDLAAELHADV